MIFSGAGNGREGDPGAARMTTNFTINKTNNPRYWQKGQIKNRFDRLLLVQSRLSSSFD